MLLVSRKVAVISGKPEQRSHGGPDIIGVPPTSLLRQPACDFFRLDAADVAPERAGKPLQLTLDVIQIERAQPLAALGINEPGKDVGYGNRRKLGFRSDAQERRDGIGQITMGAEFRLSGGPFGNCPREFDAGVLPQDLGGSGEVGHLLRGKAVNVAGALAELSGDFLRRITRFGERGGSGPLPGPVLDKSEGVGAVTLALHDDRRMVDRYGLAFFNNGFHWTSRSLSHDGFVANLSQIVNAVLLVR